MHHSGHIGSSMFPVVLTRSALGLKPISKCVAVGQFLQALLATGQPVADTKQVPTTIPDGDLQEPKAQSMLGNVAVLDTKVTEKTADPLSSEEVALSSSAPVVVVASTMPLASSKPVEASVSGPSKYAGTPKKTVQNDKGTSQPESVDVAQASDPISQATPMALQPKSEPIDTAPGRAAIQDAYVPVPVVGASGVKGSGGLVTVKGKTNKADERRVGTTVPVNSHPLPTGGVAQDGPTAPLVAPHDVQHLNRGISWQGDGVGSIGSVATSASHLTSVAKSSPVASPPIEVTSQATDLKTLVATPNVLEVGIASGSHGWLKVRAEFAQTGEVTASVVAATSSAAQSLHKELPEITAYLAGERLGVSSLVVNSAEPSAGAQDSAPNSGGGATGSANSSSHRGKDEMADVSKPSRLDVGDDVDASFLLGAVGAIAPTVLQANGNGSWLSVRV